MRVHYARRISATVWKIPCGVKIEGKEWTPQRSKVNCPKCLKLMTANPVNRRGALCHVDKSE